VGHERVENGPEKDLLSNCPCRNDDDRDLIKLALAEREISIFLERKETASRRNVALAVSWLFFSVYVMVFREALPWG
jgi:hypothetical protein